MSLRAHRETRRKSLIPQVFHNRIRQSRKGNPRCEAAVSLDRKLNRALPESLNAQSGMTEPRFRRDWGITNVPGVG